MVSTVAAHWALNDPSFAPWEDGRFSWEVQLSRLVLLAPRR